MADRSKVEICAYGNIIKVGIVKELKSITFSIDE